MNAASTQSDGLRVDLLLDSWRITGTSFQINESHRLVDVLKGEEPTFDLTDVSVRSLRGGAVLQSPAALTIEKSSIRVAIPDEPQALLSKRRLSRMGVPTSLDRAARIGVQILLPPFVLSGELHVPSLVDNQSLRIGSLGRFFPLTDAGLYLDDVEYHAGPILVLNRLLVAARGRAPHLSNDQAAETVQPDRDALETAVWRAFQAGEPSPPRRHRLRIAPPHRRVQSRLMARPPLLFVHGAANGAWVWDVWREQLKPLGWESIVIDLRGHGRSLPVDFSIVTMEDYVHDLESVTGQIVAARGVHPVIVGWSMGGLVAMMYAADHQETAGLVLLSSSPPEQIAGRVEPEVIRRTPTTAYGPEVYGIDPAEPAASRAALPELTDEEAARVIANSAGAQESGFARRQRRRGVKIAPGAIRCPTLVLYGETDAHFSAEQNRRLATYLAADAVALPDAGHWGIVYGGATVAAAAPQLDAWLGRHFEA